MQAYNVKCFTLTLHVYVIVLSKITIRFTTIAKSIYKQQSNVVQPTGRGCKKIFGFCNALCYAKQPVMGSDLQFIYPCGIFYLTFTTV